jgi:hypothetical protein
LNHLCFFFGGLFRVRAGKGDYELVVGGDLIHRLLAFGREAHGSSSEVGRRTVRLHNRANGIVFLLLLGAHRNTVSVAARGHDLKMLWVEPEDLEVPKRSSNLSLPVAPSKTLPPRKPEWIKRLSLFFNKLAPVPCSLFLVPCSLSRTTYFLEQILLVVSRAI